MYRYIVFGALYFQFIYGAVIASSLANDLASTNRFTDVFTEGIANDGYPRIRIPSIVTTSHGTILAFAEGRQAGDHSENDIILKRSTDGGKTWGSLQVVAEDGPHCLINPMAVVERESGRILLMFQRYANGFDERAALPGYDGPRVCRSYLTYSDDDGLTWRPRQEITRSVKKPEATSLASGPGIGIQLLHGQYKDRIVMPFNQGPYGKWKVYAVYSDDYGKTWQYGDTAPDGNTGIGNEVQMVELSDGAIMLNARSGSGTKFRKFAVSKDGGQTWTELKDDSALVEPRCMGSILRYPGSHKGSKSCIIFSNPTSDVKRENGTIKLSYDDGKTWPVSKTVYTGEFAYSCLTILDDGDIGLLFERDNYKHISFLKISLDWLTDQADKL